MRIDERRQGLTPLALRPRQGTGLPAVRRRRSDRRRGSRRGRCPRSWLAFCPARPAPCGRSRDRHRGPDLAVTPSCSGTMQCKQRVRRHGWASHADVAVTDRRRRIGVRRGRVLLGLIGTSGNSTTLHLHFQVITTPQDRLSVTVVVTDAEPSTVTTPLLSEEPVGLPERHRRDAPRRAELLEPRLPPGGQPGRYLELPLA
jgi:hypothetical protein